MHNADGYDLTNLRKEIETSKSAEKLGIGKDGTNQGVKHFIDYYEEFPERILKLEKMLGLEKGTFSKSVEGFDNFTLQAERVIDEAVKNNTFNNNLGLVGGKEVYFLADTISPKKGILVIKYDNLLQSMMKSTFKYFKKMEMNLK